MLLQHTPWHYSPPALRAGKSMKPGIILVENPICLTPAIICLTFWLIAHRYVCSAQTTRLADVPRILSEVYPGQVKAPTMTLPKWLFWLVGPLAGVSRADVTHR